MYALQGTSATSQKVERRREDEGDFQQLDASSLIWVSLCKRRTLLSVAFSTSKNTASYLLKRLMQQHSNVNWKKLAMRCLSTASETAPQVNNREWFSEQDNCWEILRGQWRSLFYAVPTHLYFIDENSHLKMFCWSSGWEAAVFAVMQFGWVYSSCEVNYCSNKMESVLKRSWITQVVDHLGLEK